MFQIIYDRTGDLEVKDVQSESILYINKLVVRISNKFLNPDIVSIAKQCKDLENKIQCKLKGAYFENAELNIVFEMNKNNIPVSSLHQINFFWEKTNDACLDVFPKHYPIQWKIEITAAEKLEYVDLEDLFGIEELTCRTDDMG